MSSLVRTVVVAVIVPLIIALAGIVTIVLALPELPDPIAIHWNAAGAPDGDGPVWVPILVLALVPMGFAAFVLLFVRPRQGQRQTANTRLLAATSPFLSTVLAVALGGSVVLQRGIPTAAAAPNVTWLVPIAFGAGLVLATAGWFVLPKSADRPPPDAVEKMPLASTEQGVWMQRLTPARGTTVALTLAALLLIGVAVLVWLTTPLPMAVGLTAVFVILALAMASTLAWRITVGAEGLRVRSALGVPDYRVPLAEIQEVRTVEVDPVREFGGWGVRWGGRRRWGVVLRKGSAIEVQRRNGSNFVVTVADADEGAALLASLAGRG